MENEKNIRVRRVEVEVKGDIISYDEKYVVDSSGEEIFDREIEIENDMHLYDLYKKKNNLLTIDEIKKIRSKYNLTQKDYALLIGVGEVTVHRFENGSIQTEGVDAIMRLSNNPDNMMFLLHQNRKYVSEEVFQKTLKRIKELLKYKEHVLINLKKFDDNELKFEEMPVLEISKYLIKSYNDEINKLSKKYNVKLEHITHLKLQKLLYYVQAISLKKAKKRAFKEDILAWPYGPVVYEVYMQYKNYHSKEIDINEEPPKVSSGIKAIVDEVINSYGVLETNKLIDFTHEEDPWKNTKINNVISIKLIEDYFNMIYDI